MKTQVIFEENELKMLCHIMMLSAKESFNIAMQADKDNDSEKQKHYKAIYDYSFDQYTKLSKMVND